MRKKRVSPPSGLALSLSLSEWSRLQRRANMKTRFPHASVRQLDDRMYEHLCRLERIRRRAVVNVLGKAR